MSLTVIDGAERSWLALALEALRCEGCAVVTGVLSAETIERSRAALYKVREKLLAEIGQERLQRAGELGTLRIPFKFDPLFFDYLALPHVLDIVDATVGKAAILHQQNGFILPSLDVRSTPTTYQNSFHRDFPRYLNGYLASVNTFLAIDAFTQENGATIVATGTHQRAHVPGGDYLDRAAVPVEAPAGAMLLFDSTLWHSAGRNISGKDRLAVNMQFTGSFIKQQIDYVRALGDETVLALPARTQQLLGWYTRVVTSLDEYYRPEEDRLYRRGQG